MNISFLEASLLSQLASLPFPSKENAGFESRFDLVFSSAFLILADFSAQPMIFLSVSRFLSRNSVSCSLTTLFTALAASALPSLVFVCPSNIGSGCFTATIAVRPDLVSAPVKLSSFSLRMPSSLAYELIIVVKRFLNPVICMPPSTLYILLQKPRMVSS